MMNINDFTFEPDKLNDYELHVIVGEPNAPDGQTVVILQGNGGLEARQSFGSKDIQQKNNQRYIQGKLENVSEVFKSLENFDWQRKFPSRPGIPDEAIVNWVVEVQGEKRASLKMWLGEAEEDKRYSEILEKLRNIVGRLSENQIFI